jgi:hypothetical protein
LREEKEARVAKKEGARARKRAREEGRESKGGGGAGGGPKKGMSRPLGRPCFEWPAIAPVGWALVFEILNRRV